MPEAAAAQRGKRLHPLPLRVMHWVNAVAMIVMIGSGWRIYEDEPLFGWLSFPYAITLGGDPEVSSALRENAAAGALQWHFVGMWVLGLNGLAYLAYGSVTGRFRRKLLPVRAARGAARGRAGAALPPEARRPHRVQLGAKAALYRRHRRRDRPGAGGARHLEAGAALVAHRDVRRLPGRAARALSRHGRDRGFPGRARRAGAAGAAHPPRHGERWAAREGAGTDAAADADPAAPSALQPGE